MRHSFAPAVRAALVTAFCATATSNAAPHPDEVTARVREALGPDWARTHAGLHGSGSGQFAGHDGPLDLVLAADGRFVRRLHAGVLDAFGFDGEDVWTVDWSGMPRRLEQVERDWTVLTMAVASSAWVREGFPFDLAAAPGAPADTPALEFRSGADAEPVTLYLNPRTFLPDSLARNAASGRRVARFSEWSDVGGQKMPLRIERSVAGQETVYEFDRIVPVSELDAAAFHMPPAPDDAAFAAGVPATLELRRARTGHLLVKPLIDGRDLGWFIFDSGAGNSTLSPEAADALGLPAIAETQVMSIVGVAPAQVRRARTLTLGPLTIEKPVFVDFDLGPFEAALGEKVAGVIGFDVMCRAIVELEIANDRLALHDPARFDTAGLPWQRLTLLDRHPAVQASFEGHEGLFKLDFGAAGGPPGNVTMHVPAVERLGLLEGRDVQRHNSQAGEIAIGQARWFELAGHRFESPAVMFATGRDRSPFQDRETLGNIGLGFMAPFRMVFDYANRRVAMVERTAG